MIDSPIQQIKERLDIVEVISSYLKLEKAGANYRALCPFHSEKTPSFFVSPARQIWHCFGCNLGGDVFKFVMLIEGIEFADAMRILAQKAGVQLKKQDPRLESQRKRLYEISELSTIFFEKQLAESKPGLKAKQYLLERRVSEDSIKKWRLGFAPNTLQSLFKFLTSRGYKIEEIKRAGLIFQNEKGDFTDRFRNRIIFPVFDLNSQVIGFAGRILPGSEKGEAKYINTPNTLLYDKSRVLYNLDKAKIAIRKEDSCILVEGYLDAIMSAQAGVENVVATSGTALTNFHLQILKRYTQNLLLSFDMDLAGDSATKRGIELAQAEGFNLKIILMPKEKDPADVVAASPRDWKKLIQKAKDIISFYFETTFGKFPKKASFEPEEKVAICQELLPPIKRIPNKVLQSHWIAELAKRIRVKEEDLAEELKKYSPGEPAEKIEVPLSERRPREILLEERILSLILRDPSQLDILGEEFKFLFSQKSQIILTGLREKKINKNGLNFFGPKLDQETLQYLNYLSLKSEIEGNLPDIKREIFSCLKELKSLAIKKELERISQEIKEAEIKKDFQKIDSLLEKFDELAKRLG